MRTLYGLALIAVLSACAQVPAPAVTADLVGSASEATVFSVAPGERVNIFTGASAGAMAGTPQAPRDWPTFRVCRAADSEGDVTLAIGALDRFGPRHPEILHLTVTPGSCHFVSGPIIEAVGAGRDTSPALLANPADPSARGGAGHGSSPAALIVTLVTPEPAE